MAFFCSKIVYATPSFSLSPNPKVRKLSLAPLNAYIRERIFAKEQIFAMETAHFFLIFVFFFVPD